MLLRSFQPAHQSWKASSSSGLSSSYLVLRKLLYARRASRSDSESMAPGRSATQRLEGTELQLTPSAKRTFGLKGPGTCCAVSWSMCGGCGSAQRTACQTEALEAYQRTRHGCGHDGATNYAPHIHYTHAARKRWSAWARGALYGVSPSDLVSCA
jgi:hypothetical protein